MDTIKKFYVKLEKSHFGIIILIQSVIILLLVFYILSSNRPPSVSSAQENTFSEEITRDAKACLSLDFSERPVCAKAAGAKIGQHSPDPVERLRECLKFRPYYVHYCQLGFSE